MRAMLIFLQIYLIGFYLIHRLIEYVFTLKEPLIVSEGHKKLFLEIVKILSYIVPNPI